MPRQGIAPRAQNAPMKAPPRLQSLIEEGLIDTVVRQLARRFAVSVEAANIRLLKLELLKEPTASGSLF